MEVAYELLAKLWQGDGTPLGLYVVRVSRHSQAAVTVAWQFGATLIGFLRRERFKVHSGFDTVRTGEEYERSPKEQERGDLWRARQPTRTLLTGG